MLLPAGVPLSFSVAFDSPSLFVGMSVYDDSGASPVLLLSPFAMTHVVGNSYRGKFTAANGKAYIVLMAVYTDGTFTALNPSYTEVVQSVNAQFLTPSVQSLVGEIDSSNVFSGEMGNPIFTIFLGNNKTMYLAITNDECCGGGPLDLSLCTEIDIALPNQDGTFAHLLYSTGGVAITQPPVLGKFSAAVSTAVSALLNTGEYQDVDVTLTIAGEKSTVRFPGSLSVFEVR